MQEASYELGRVFGNSLPANGPYWRHQRIH